MNIVLAMVAMTTSDYNEGKNWTNGDDNDRNAHDGAKEHDHCYTHIAMGSAAHTMRTKLQ